MPPLGVYHRPFTICVNSAGKNGLEDLEEGADEGSGMGAWWRWFFLVIGVIIVVAGLCCSVKLCWH